jgi:hypothetical protein
MTDTPAVAAAGAGATRRTPCVPGHDRGHDPASVSPIGCGNLHARAGRSLAACFTRYQRTVAAMPQTTCYEDGGRITSFAPDPPRCINRVSVKVEAVALRPIERMLVTDLHGYSRAME